jgi:amidohydrolase
MGADYELNFEFAYPPTINDEFMADVVGRCAALVVGKESVLVPDKIMGGEDFSFYAQKSKGCFFFLGVGREGSTPVHNPKFDFKEDLMLLGVETYCHVALELMQ